MPKNKPHSPVKVAQEAGTSTQTTLAQLKQDPSLWYKIQVLCYDFRNFKTNPESQKRTDSIIDLNYISGPYFTDSEGVLIKSATVSIAPPRTTEFDDEHGHQNEENAEQEGKKEEERQITIEQAIQERLKGFIDKRKASGDFRLCGPHDLAPIFEQIFGIEKNELEDERFLGRLSRAGLSEGKKERESGSGKEKKGKKGR